MPALPSITAILTLIQTAMVPLIVAETSERNLPEHLAKAHACLGTAFDALTALTEKVAAHD